MADTATDVADLFRRAWAAEPTHRACAPGRVNLIGEHLDYNDLPVFPMALERSVHIHFRPLSEPEVRLASTDAAYGERRFELSRGIHAYPAGDWGNYAKAAAQAVARQFGSVTGIEGVVDSDLHIGGGLSSSAALVVAVALAILEVNGLTYDRLDLAGALARGERYVGTRSGGMDQAICLLARKGTACRIDFRPLAVSHVPVPGGWSFVMAYSGMPAEKSGGARDAYNARTRESREALERAGAEVAGAGSGSGPPRSWPAFVESSPAEELLAAGERAMDGPLLRRFRHIVTEWERVGRAEEAMRSGDDAGLEAFGRLLDASHASLRDDFEVSTPELDELVTAARHSGAAGARLTGAGFGGSVVALVRSDAVEPLIEGIEERYYTPRGMAGRADGHLFVAEPGGAATVGRSPASR